MNIHLLTLNVAQQPVRIFTGLKNRNKRARRLVDKIFELNPQPDIICFQELFRKKSQKLIIKALKHIYPFYYLDESPGKYIIGVNSGLAIFSKFPITEKTLYTYTKFRGVENFAKKGLMGIKIQIDDNNEMYVFTTHLQTGIGAEPCICKYFDTNDWSSNQLKSFQVQEAIDQITHITHDKHIPIVFTGDFNIRAIKPLYNTIQEKLDNIGLNDIYDEDESPIDTTVIGKPDRRIDYIWTNTTGNSVVTTEFGDIVGYITDHYGVIGYI